MVIQMHFFQVLLPSGPGETLVFDLPQNEKGASLYLGRQQFGLVLQLYMLKDV